MRVIPVLARMRLWAGGASDVWFDKLQANKPAAAPIPKPGT